MKNFLLDNGIDIPCIGFGTWKVPDGKIVIDAVKKAILCGYTHIDTASYYKNEKGIGKAINECDIDRKKLFITSKLWNTDRGYYSTLKAFDRTLNCLEMDYLDLYLIHWPAVSKNFENWEEINSDTWCAFEKIYKSGRVRSIGVSNFLPHHLDSLMKNSNINPMVNQIEFHIGFLQKETIDFCRDKNIVVEAWSPLGSGKILDNEILNKVASKYNVSVAQLCIKWCLENNTIPLPRSVNSRRIEKNIDVFDFEIDLEDMKNLNKIEYIGGSGLEPDNVDF